MRPLNINDLQRDESFIEILGREAFNDLEEKRAGLFAYIHYSDRNYFLNEAFDNKRFYNTLNEISGRKLSVFFIDNRKTFDGTNNLRIEQRNREIIESLELTGEIDRYSAYLILFRVKDNGDISKEDAILNLIKGDTKEGVQVNLEERIKLIINAINKSSFKAYETNKQLLEEVTKEINKNRSIKFGKAGAKMVFKALQTYYGFV